MSQNQQFSMPPTSARLGAPPPPPPPKEKEKAAHMVNITNLRDREGVFNVYSVYLSGTDNKSPRDTISNKQWDLHEISNMHP